MGRNFAASDKITLGDITAARFLDNTAWSVMGFIRVENLSSNHLIIAKYGASGTRQIRFFTRTNGAVRLRHNENTVNPDTAAGVVSVGVWYLAAATADSSGQLNTYVFDADSLAGSASDTLSGDSSDLTAPITLGEEEAGASDHNGDLAHVAYFDVEFSQAQLESYRSNPVAFVAQHNADCVFYLPLTGFSSPEPDWAGRGNSGAISSGTTAGNNPPVSMSMPISELAPGGAVPPVGGVFAPYYYSLLTGGGV